MQLSEEKVGVLAFERKVTQVSLKDRLSSCPLFLVSKRNFQKLMPPKGKVQVSGYNRRGTIVPRETFEWRLMKIFTIKHCLWMNATYIQVEENLTYATTEIPDENSEKPFSLL